MAKIYSFKKKERKKKSAPFLKPNKNEQKYLWKLIKIYIQQHGLIKICYH